MDNNQTIRFKLVFIENYEVSDPYSYDYAGMASAAHDFQWRELSEDQFHRMKMAVDHYNAKHKDKTSVLIIRDPGDEDVRLLLQNHDLYLEEMEKKAEAVRKAAQEAKAKRAQKDIERKKKQMEKLRKEIESSQSDPT